MRNGLTYLTERIKCWSIERGLDKQSPSKELNKLMEEVGELASALNKNNTGLIADSIGDIYIVLTVLSQQLELDIRDCVELAYLEIRDRKGEIVDGNFVKQEDLREANR